MCRQVKSAQCMWLSWHFWACAGDDRQAGLMQALSVAAAHSARLPQQPATINAVMQELQQRMDAVDAIMEEVSQMRREDQEKFATWQRTFKAALERFSIFRTDKRKLGLHVTQQALQADSTLNGVLEGRN